MSIYPCVEWVSRGKAKPNPDRVKIDPDVLKKIIGETQERLEEEEEAEDEENVDTGKNNAEVKAAAAAARKVKGLDKGEGDDVDAKYSMDDYDDEDSDLGNPLKGMGGLTVFSSNDEDPYITMKEDDDSDEEDQEIKATDNLLVVGKAVKEFCSLEVYVYNAELANFFVHHEILLSSFPLSIEWLDYDITQDKPGNFVAIASMEPTIEIWDLDLVDSLEPMAVLGARLKKKKKKKSEQAGHTDAVLDLSWNPNVRHVLASASADHTIGLWDLSQGTMATIIRHHTDKVQCLVWHPVEEHMLLSGSFDKTVKLTDCRAAETNFKSWLLNGEVEKVLWNPASPIHFFATTDNGHVFYMDSRQDTPIYTLAAHSDGITGICLNSEKPTMLVTASTDQTLKVWDTSDNKPSIVLSKKMQLGQIHSLSACPDTPYALAISGDKNIKVWDIRQSKDVFNHFCAPGGEKYEGYEVGENDDDEPEATMEDDEEEEQEDISMEAGAVAMDTVHDTSKPKAAGKFQKKKKKKKPKRF